MPLEQIITLAGDPAVASAATTASCGRLCEVLLTAAGNQEEPASLLLLANLLESHAYRLDNLGRYGEALSLYDAILPVAERYGSPVIPAICRMHRAIVLNNLGQHAEAMAGYDAALPPLQKHGTPANVAHCHANRANSLQQLGRHAEAVADYDAAVLLFLEHGTPADVARCQMNRATALHRLGRHAEAVAGYDAALPLLRQHGTPTDVALCHVNRANPLHQLGRHAEAVTSCDAALPLLRQHGTPADVAGYHTNRANALAGLGRHAEAITGYDAALLLLRQYGTPADVARCHMNRATTLHQLGRLAEAAADVDAALALLRHHGTPRDVARCHMNRANVLQDLERHEEAAAGYDAALALFRQHGTPASVARCQANRATALKGLGRYAEAVAGYDAALPLLQEFATPADVARCQANRATAFAQLGRHAEAVVGYDLALPLFQEHSTPADVALCYVNRARALQRLGRHAEALASYREVNTSMLRIDDLVKHHRGLGQALWEQGQPEHALEHFDRARQATRRARRTAGIDDTSLEFVAARSGVINQAVCYALCLGRVEDAFAAALDGKGSVLGDLRHRLNDQTGDDLPSVATARQQLIDYLRQPLTSGSRRTEQRRLTEAYLRVWAQFGHAYRHDALDRFVSDKHVPLAAIQSALPSDWALLDFWRTQDEEFTVFVLTRDGLRVEKLPFPVKPSVAAKLQCLFHSVVAPLPSPNDEALDDLHAYLFAPLRRWLHERHIRGLYLVPHDFLHALPLHASRRREKGRNVYLCDDYAIAYLPSASLLPQLPPLHAGQGVLSFANPERGTKDSLPFADWEGQTLRQQLGAAAGSFHAGSAATFAATGVWSDAGLVHFSCHGFGEPSFAPLSHLRLADDLLLAHDVLYRRPPLRDGSLVILNGCETAERDWRAVDEGMGLMTAFLLRGASLVLATQWSVVDACAAEMVLTFTRELLRKGTSPTDALRQAQARARALTAEEVLARCDDVLKQFPADAAPEEAAKVEALAAWVCRRAGLASLAREHGEKAERLLRRLHRDAEADRIAALTRSGRAGVEECRLGSPGLDRPVFGHPVFWSAFQLIGRVA
jgi:tetratricopeptide (TPR) repeat protein/CHAT domain-containing protein